MADYEVTDTTIKGFRREEYGSGRVIYRDDSGSFVSEEDYIESDKVYRTLLHRGYFSREGGYSLEAEVKIWQVSLERHDISPMWDIMSEIESNEGLLNMQTRDMAMEYNEKIDSDEVQDSYVLDEIHNRVWFKDRSYAYEWTGDGLEGI